MAIETWLLGGVVTDDHILPAYQSCWSREDLVDVPSMIQYRVDGDPKMLRVFSNNVGCRVVLIPYGCFETLDAMMTAYHGNTESGYHKAYAQALKQVEEVSGTTLTELDWIMPVVKGNLHIEADFCSVPDLEQEKKELVSLIDCCMIYSTVKMISVFISSLCSRKRLTRFEQYQLAYYHMILQEIENPGSFLTNKTEIEIYNEIYEKWNLNRSIEIAVGNARQAVELFSFLSEYKTRNNSELSSSFLTLFGIVVGLEAIYNLSVSLRGGASKGFNTLFLSLIAVLLTIACIILSGKLVQQRKESLEYRRKTEALRKNGAKKRDVHSKSKSLTR